MSPIVRAAFACHRNVSFAGAFFFCVSKESMPIDVDPAGQSVVPSAKANNNESKQ